MEDTELEIEIAQLWGHINAATSRFLDLIARFDNERGYERHGLTNTAQWLNWQCGIGVVAAREKLRVAHALVALPKLSAAFRDGRLSYSKVRAATRVATPSNEEALLNIALHGTAVHVERIVRRYRRVRQIEEAQQEAQRYEKRFARCYCDADGSFVLYAKLPPEVGALIQQALESQTNESPLDDSAESREARRADALVELIDPKRATENRYEIVVHVEASNGACSIEDGPTLTEQTGRRIACDAAIVTMSQDTHGNPLSLGRRTRAITPALRKALKRRDGGCRFPGCTHTRFVDGHHIVHWADGGETNLSNLVLLCTHHHRLVHEGGYDVRLTDDGVFVFTDRAGRRIPECQTLKARFRGNIDDLAFDVPPNLLMNRWNGDALDYNQALAWMHHQDRL